jgi:YVTN family beta-propeller protein
MPLSAEAKKMKREDYPFDSAHHGLALSGDGSKLCVAGTISDYVAIVSRPGLTVDKYLSTGDQPYWATSSPDGRYCYVSNSLSDTVSVISFDGAQEVRRIPVGHHPQRIRVAPIPADVLP